MIDDYEFVNTYPTQLFPCYKGRTTTDSVYYSVYPEISNTSAETGSLNRSLAHYKCDMTYHVSDLKNKDAEKITDSDNIWLFPIYTAQDIYGNTSYYPNTYTYYYQILNGNGAERKPELKIVYAVIEE